MNDKICPTCNTLMKSLGGVGYYCPNDDCGRDNTVRDEISLTDVDDFDNAPTQEWSPIGVTGSLKIVDGRCLDCGSDQIADFEVNGVNRKHCWGCGNVSPEES